MNRPSALLFLFSAVLFFACSLFYLTQPLTPSIESFNGLSSLGYPFYGQYVNSLTATLQRIICINLFALSLLTAYLGFWVWQDNFAWAIGFSIMLCYALPLAIAAVRSSGVFILTFLPMIPFAIGLILALTLDRSEEKDIPRWPKKMITLK
jgi:hypothetical protein